MSETWRLEVKICFTFFLSASETFFLFSLINGSAHCGNGSWVQNNMLDRNVMNHVLSIGVSFIFNFYNIFFSILD